MCEIKFRAWDGEAITNVYDIVWTAGGVRYSDGCTTEKWVSLNPSFNEWEREKPTDFAVLMQSTGLKDRNGKEIYEGDIIEVDGLIAQVIFRDGVYCALPLSIDRDKWISDENFQDISFCHLKLNEWKVVGNIYENPELIQANK